MSGPRARRSPPRQSRRVFVRLAAGGAAGLVLACGPSGPPPAGPPPAAPASPDASAAPSPTVRRRVPDVVRRGTLRGISFGAVIARERGYFAELGVDDQETVFDSGAEMTQALATDQIEVGATSNTGAFFNALARGLRLPFVLDIWHLERGDQSWMVVVRPDLVDEIKQVSDLRGRVHAIASPVRDGGSSFLAKKVFDTAGLSLDDAQWERLGYPDMLPALGNGAVEIGWVIEPFITLGKQRALLTPWISCGDYDPGYQGAGIVFSESFLKDRNEIARRWSVGYVRGLRDQLDFMSKGKDRDVIAPILAAHTGLPVGVVDQVGWGPVSPDGRLNLDSVLESQRQLVEWGTINQSLPADQLVDPQFSEYAVQQLGPYRA